MHGHRDKTSDEALLASLGYKQEFRRVYGRLEILGVAVSILSTGPAMPAVLSIPLSNGGAAAMVWGWAGCSLFILCVGMALAEIASSAPTAGGLYYLTYNLCSPRHRRILCWLVGYASTTSFVAGLASVNWGLSAQITAAVSIGTDLKFSPTLQQSYGIYVALIASQGVLCSLGAKLLAKLQIMYLVLNILICFIIIIAFPIATPSRLMNSASYALGNVSNETGWPSSFSFLLGMLAPLWVTGGYDAALHMSEEVANAAVAVPLAMISSIIFAAVIGLAINVSLAFSMGTNVESLLASPVDQPMAQMALNSFGKTWTLVLWSLIILALYTTSANTLLVASRQMFAFARDGVLPFSSLLRQFNHRTKTPVNTVWFAALTASVLGLLCLSGPAAINAIFSIPMTGQNIAFAIPIAARFLFNNNFKPGPFTLGRFGRPVAVIAVVFQLVMTVIICFPSRPNPTPGNMNYTSVVIGAIMAFAFTWYYFPSYGAVHWFEGPVHNVTPTTPQISEEKVEDHEKQVDVGITNG